MFFNLHKMDQASIKKAKKMVVAEGFKNPRKRIMIPTQMRTDTRLILCPTGCTQHRSPKNKLRQKRTFDPKINTCLFCGFSKSHKSERHTPVFQKASRL